MGRGGGGRTAPVPLDSSKRKETFGGGASSSGAHSGRVSSLRCTMNSASCRAPASTPGTARAGGGGGGGRRRWRVRVWGGGLDRERGGGGAEVGRVGGGEGRGVEVVGLGRVQLEACGAGAGSRGQHPAGGERRGNAKGPSAVLAGASAAAAQLRRSTKHRIALRCRYLPVGVLRSQQGWGVGGTSEALRDEAGDVRRVSVEQLLHVLGAQVSCQLEPARLVYPLEAFHPPLRWEPAAHQPAP